MASLTRRQAVTAVAAIVSGSAVVGRDAPAWAQRLAEARRAKPVLTLDLGQWELIAVRHPILGSEPYYLDTADIVRALTEEP